MKEILFRGSSEPYLAALTRNEVGGLAEHLNVIAPVLPDEFTATLHSGLVATMRQRFRVRSRTTFVQMALLFPDRLDDVDISAVVPIRPVQRDEVEALCRGAYPGNHFHPDALATGQFNGVRHLGRLIVSDSVHVYAPNARVAALEYIATHPDFRRQGIARAVTVAVCRSVLREAEHVGRLVERANTRAIHCYEQVGLVRHYRVDGVQVSGRTVKT